MESRALEDSCPLIGYKKVINDGELGLRMQPLGTDRIKLPK